MRKLFLCLATIALAAGCSADDELDSTPTSNDGERIIVKATLDNQSDATRAHLDRDGNVFTFKWTTGDKISVFKGSTANSELTLIEGGDSPLGVFEGTAASGGTAIKGSYATLPYSSANEISADGVFTVSYPATQTYRADSYGEGSNVMVAKSDDTNFQFKNANGFLELKLTGSGVVKYITVKGNCDEPLADKASIAIGEDGLPITTMFGGFESTSSITLDCGDGVRLSDVPTSFIIALPPTEFTEGFTATITNDAFVGMTKSTTKSLSIVRNRITPMSAFEFEPTQQYSNKIEYKATEAVTPYDVNVFGAKYNAANSSYDAATGRGVIAFDGAVTRIGASAFASDKYLTGITIPEGVTSIDEHAFFDCSVLESINISKSVASIGELAFAYCPSMTSMNVNAANTVLDSRNGCNAIIETATNTLINGCKNTVIPKGVTSIGYGAFWGCTYLTSITIPEGVTSIGSAALLHCTSLTDIVIPEGVTSIGLGAFQRCTSLINLTIPGSALSTGDAICLDCPKLENVTLSEGVAAIGFAAFRECASLASINIPKSVVSIGDVAFYGCPVLSSVIISEGVTTIGELAFGECNALTSINIPKSVVSIGIGAFFACPVLSEVIISEGVTTIGEGAFQNCDALEGIIIPASVTSIGRSAFGNCSVLKSVFCNRETPPTLDDWPFYNTTADLVIHVPNEAAAKAYKAAEIWRDYADKIQ